MQIFENAVKGKCKNPDEQKIFLEIINFRPQSLDSYIDELIAKVKSIVTNEKETISDLILCFEYSRKIKFDSEYNEQNDNHELRDLDHSTFELASALVPKMKKIFDANSGTEQDVKEAQLLLLRMILNGKIRGKIKK